MPQRQQLVWSQLRVGLLTLTSLVLLTIGIFLIGGQVGFFTKKITLRTLCPDAGGIKSGAPVRLAGIDVGSVRAVKISGAGDPAQAVEVSMDVVQEYQSQIHADSEAFLAAEGLLGERYVNISKGTPTAPVVPNGALIPFHSTAEFSELVGGSRDLLDNLNVLTERLNNVVGDIEKGNGTIGKLLVDDSLYKKLASTVDTIQTLAEDLSTGKGSIGKLLSSDEFYQHVDATVMKIQNAIDQIQNGDGTIGKLIRDPTLYQKADRLVSSGTTLVDNVNQGRGTLGKLAQDEELYHRLNAATENLNQVLASLNEGKGSLGRLLHDPAFYENLNSASLEVRGLLADFRQNPKKFLTIHFKIF